MQDRERFHEAGSVRRERARERERELSGERRGVHECDRDARFRNDLGFESIARDHEEHVERRERRVVAKRFGDRETGIDVATRPSAREHELHALRARPTLTMSATATSDVTSDVPPNEMNGNGTPVTGHDDETTPRFTNA